MLKADSMKSLSHTVEKHKLNGTETRWGGVFWLWIEDNAQEMNNLEFASWNKILALALKGERDDKEKTR